MCVYCTSNGSGLGLRWPVYFFPFEPVLRIHNMLVWIRIWIRVSRKTDYWLVAQYYVFLLEWPALLNDQYHNCKTRMAGKLEWPESRTDRKIGTTGLIVYGRNKAPCVNKQCGPYLQHLSYIHLGSSVCLSSCHIPVVLSYSCRPVIFLSSCHIPVIFAERWAILYVLVIKVTE